MSERIDHAEKARQLIESAYSDDPAVLDGVKALTHATLALVEQQRLANLIALSRSSYGGTMAEAASAALSTFTEDDAWNATVIIRPEVREALGL